MGSWRKWCADHKIPYIHGCVWDRDCRRNGLSPPRIALLWNDHMWWVDLPGYWYGINTRHDFRIGYGWRRIAFGHSKPRAAPV